jgi:ABC-type nitrate/sulfonate/bicarbonate transport system substrate-binding protein
MSKSDVRKLFAGPSRRDVLKGGAGVGLAALGATSGLPTRAFAVGKKLHPVNIVNASGSLSLLQVTIFKELDLMPKYGVEPNFLNVSDGNKILAGIISGDGDICGGSGFNGLFPAIEKGAAIKIVAGAGIAPLNILYSRIPEIKSIKDLPGHTVGTGAPGALLHQLVVATMLKYKVDYKKVKFVNVGSSTDVFKALVGGNVEAGAAPIEFRDTAGKYGLHPLVDGEFWKELPDYTNQAMYVSDRAIAEKREGLIGVLAAYAHLFRWIGKPQNKQAFLDYYKKAVPNGTRDTAVFLQDFLSKPNRLATNLVLTPDKLRYVQDLNVRLGSQKAILPFDKCADMSLAEAALKMVTV